jgi:hypothetical protein
MELIEKQWYEAINMFNEVWYNYFFELEGTVKYISIEPNFSNVSYIEESEREFKSMLGSFDFEETTISEKDERKIIRGLLS